MPASFPTHNSIPMNFDGIGNRRESPTIGLQLHQHVLYFTHSLRMNDNVISCQCLDFISIDLTNNDIIIYCS